MPERAYFISDAHLGVPNGRRSTDDHQDALIAFLRFVGETGTQLYIVGDLFDFWFEYRSSVPTIGARVIFELYALVQRGVEVVILPGNHDIWLGDYLSQQVGLKIAPNPLVHEIQGKKLFITHGDDFKPSVQFSISRAILKSTFCIRLFRLLHPDIGVGRMMTHLSDHRARIKPRNDRRVYEHVAERLIGEGHDIVVCGHFHHGIDLPIYEGQLIVLGNWIRSDTYAEMEDGQIRLMHWNGVEGEPVERQ